MPPPCLRPIFPGRDEPEPCEVPPPPGLRVALLFGGHSLVEDWNDTQAARFDAVVAVNGAAYAFPCDFALMVDRAVVHGLFARKDRHPRQALVTYTRPYMRDAHRAGIANVLEVPKLERGYKSYSAPRALKFALARCGPEGCIEIFGMDWSSEKNDVAGLKGCHNDNRWKQEADAFRSIWDRRIVAVHGRIAARRLAFIRGEVPVWPG